MTSPRSAARKLWLRWRARPREQVSPRDFWIGMLVVLLPLCMVLAAFDAPLLSLTKAIIFAGGLVWVVVAYKVLTRFGVIGDRPPR